MIGYLLLKWAVLKVDKGSSSLFITYRDEAPAMYKTWDLKIDQQPPIKLYIHFFRTKTRSHQEYPVDSHHLFTEVAEVYLQ